MTQCRHWDKGPTRTGRSFVRLILWGAEVCLRPAVIILWRGIVVTVMMVVVVVVLWGGVVVVVVVVTLDVPVGKEHRGGGGGGLMGGRRARRRSPGALDGPVPTGRSQLGGAGEEAERKQRVNQ